MKMEADDSSEEDVDPDEAHKMHLNNEMKKSLTSILVQVTDSMFGEPCTSSWSHGGTLLVCMLSHRARPHGCVVWPGYGEVSASDHIHALGFRPNLGCWDIDVHESIKMTMFH